MQDWFYVKKVNFVIHQNRSQKAELNIASRGLVVSFLWELVITAYVHEHHFRLQSYPLFILIPWSCNSFCVCVCVCGCVCVCVCVCVMVLRQWKRISSSCFIFFRVTGCGHIDFNQSIFNDWTRNQRQRGGNNKPLSLEKRHVKYLEFHTPVLDVFVWFNQIQNM